jgi:hypothetical protein
MADLDAVSGPSADAYLGYTSGSWPTYAALVHRFGNSAHVVSCAVTARYNAMCLDHEPGDATRDQVAPWVHTQLNGPPPLNYRPIVYTSASEMGATYAAIQASGVTRNRVRLLSAHYGAGKHICGPHTCGLVSFDCDGTQWTDSAPGASGSKIDESVLLDNFFAGVTPKPRPAPVIHSHLTTEEPMMLVNGTQAETIITMPAGSAKGIEFGCDAARTGANAPVLRVAILSGSEWDVRKSLQLEPSGRTPVDFKAGTKAGMVSVVRVSGGAADNVPVGCNLY